MRRVLGLDSFLGAQVRTEHGGGARCSSLSSFMWRFHVASVTSSRVHSPQDGRLGRGIDAISRGVCAEADVDT